MADCEVGTRDIDPSGRSCSSHTAERGDGKITGDLMAVGDPYSTSETALRGVLVLDARSNLVPSGQSDGWILTNSP